MPDLCLVDATDPAVTILTLNRPERRNALSVDLIRRLASRVRESAQDLNRRVILICGAGPVFCAGLDLHEASDPDVADQSAAALAELYGAVCQSPLVTIAAAQGAAIGGGVGLMAACDLVVASDDLRVGFPEVHRGLVAALVTCMVRRQVLERSVRELILLGQSISAERALALGLVNRVAPADRLQDEAIGLARQACRGAPGAVARSKRLLDDLSHRPIAEDLMRALDYHLQARQSAEATEGVKAFVEKRSPRWGPRPKDS